MLKFIYFVLLGKYLSLQDGKLYDLEEIEDEIVLPYSDIVEHANSINDLLYLHLDDSVYGSTVYLSIVDYKLFCRKQENLFSLELYNSSDKLSLYVMNFESTAIRLGRKYSSNIDLVFVQNNACRVMFYCLYRFNEMWVIGVLVSVGFESLKIRLLVSEDLKLKSMHVSGDNIDSVTINEDFIDKNLNARFSLSCMP